MYPATVTRDVAESICAADGAELPKVITAKDKSAMMHYGNQNLLWTGLKKINNVNTHCIDSACNGLLQWDDGTAYAHDASINITVEVDAPNSNQNCFRFRADSEHIGDLQCNSKEFPTVCQFTPPQDYKFREGKYYRVIP